MMNAVIVTGDRHAEWNAWRQVMRTALLQTGFKGETGVLIHGDARGIDWIGARVGGMHGWSVIPVPALWKVDGKAAGPRRNRKMLEILTILDNQGYETQVLAFHDDIAGSKGTRDMVTIARNAGFPVTVYHRDGTTETEQMELAVTP